ncbi:MAG: hypothetical protein KAY65_02770 [Planctomycetes bacterium]|nr:hypothetical protein [Planctomycetota bacterium]
MIIEEIRNIKSSVRELRKFAWAMAVPLALIGAFLLWRQKDFYWYFFAASALFVLLGLLAPVVLKPIHKCWMTLAIIMGWFMTRLILIILFFLVLTPTALLLRLLRKDLLNIKFDSNSSETYWLPRPTDDSQKPDYTKQF